MADSEVVEFISRMSAPEVKLLLQEVQSLQSGQMPLEEFKKMIENRFGYDRLQEILALDRPIV
jgi:hypothetical protein